MNFPKDPLKLRRCVLQPPNWNSLWFTIYASIRWKLCRPMYTWRWM